MSPCRSAFPAREDGSRNPFAPTDPAAPSSHATIIAAVLVVSIIVLGGWLGFNLAGAIR